MVKNTNGMTHKKEDSELSPELYNVARQGGTEPAFTGKYWNEHAKGMYRCTVCGTQLFSSEAKFDSGTGWPSFTEPVDRERVEFREDTSGGMVRREALCKKCGAHLGHVFPDGPKDRGAERYCVISVCLDLEKEDEIMKENY